MGEWDEEKLPHRGNGHASLSAEEEASARLQETLENARQEIETYVETAADFIRQRPVACVAAAIGVGFLIGKIASRR